MSHRLPLLLSILLCGGCAADPPEGETVPVAEREAAERAALSPEDEARTAEEVRATFGAMRDAILALDLDRALEFFADDAPPVHSVDGQIFVGMDEIGPAFREGMAPVAEFDRVDVTREELEVLGPATASYAFSFHETFRTGAGDTIELSGAWTMVFHRMDEGWRIVHSAASHGG